MPREKTMEMQAAIKKYGAFAVFRAISKSERDANTPVLEAAEYARGLILEPMQLIIIESDVKFLNASRRRWRNLGK